MADLSAAGLGEYEQVAAYEENPAVEALIRAWCNEKSSPELLPYEAALIDAPEDGLLPLVEAAKFFRALASALEGSTSCSRQRSSWVRLSVSNVSKALHNCKC